MVSLKRIRGLKESGVHKSMSIWEISQGTSFGKGQFSESRPITIRV